MRLESHVHPIRPSCLMTVLLGPAAVLLAGCGDGGMVNRAAPDAASDVVANVAPDVVANVAPGAPGDSGAMDATPPFNLGGCMWDSKFTYGVDFDDTTLGHSARDVGIAFSKNGPGLLRWFDGSQTVLHITADVSRASVTIDDPPPYQGYCARIMRLENVTFAITTDDGRLSETVFSSLIADDVGGPVVSIWSELALDIEQVQGSLKVPDNWRLPEHTQQHLSFIVNSRTNLESPYCLVGEPRDEKPTSDCTASSGKIVYYGSLSRGEIYQSLVVELVATWNWQ